MPLQKIACRVSDAVFQLRFAGGARAMDAAENLSVCFDAVADHPAAAVRANWRQRMDRALEAIEGVMLPADDHFKGFVVFIFANFACSHTQIFRTPLLLRWCPLYLRSPTKLAGIADPVVPWPAWFEGEAVQLSLQL